MKMFGSLRKYNRVLLIGLIALTIAAQSEVIILTGSFVERREIWGPGYLNGTFYYLYDTSNEDNCRLRFEYNVHYLNTTVISNLYHYKDAAMYSMRAEEKCTGLKINERPDPWWFNESLYERTDEMSKGKYWFRRKTAAANSTGQVLRILMDEGVTSENLPNEYLGGIQFIDGRNVEFSKVRKVESGIDETSPIFEPISICPTPTCPIYADIVFVLDSSGSVNYSEWAETVNFVNLVMNSFTFGKNAAYAAVVQFCGQDDKTYKSKLNKEYEPDCGGKQRFYQDSDWPVKTRWENGKKLDLSLPHNYMASVLAGFRYGDTSSFASVSPNPDELMRELNATLRTTCAYDPRGENVSSCQAFPFYRGTCQALGLTVAMKVLDESPRRNYLTKPHNIVIVVTDGEDKYPNMTARNATLLRDNYDAFLIEVGVGLECEYDRKYLRSIASKLGSGNNSAYFDAKDYSEIKRISEELFTPLCDTNYSSECGLECKGFCGAGQCLCPDCDDSGDVCHMVLCNVSGSFSNGCVVYDKPSDIANDSCMGYTCDPNYEEEGQEKKGKWNNVPNLCQEMKDNNPGTCREISCRLDYGGCRLELNNSKCKNVGVTKCEDWECTPEGKVATDNSTGCTLRQNYTDNCVKNLGKKASCMHIECDGSSMDCKDMEVDDCTKLNNKCYTYSCQEGEDGEYSCVGTMTDHLDNTYCTEWACDNDAGWKIVVDRTEEFCMYAYGNLSENIQNSSATKCKDFYCDPLVESNINGGCTYRERPGCTTQCDEVFESTCRSDAVSENDNCVSNFCVIVDVGNNNFERRCASQTETVQTTTQNCLDPNNPASIRARELNKENPELCYTPICLGGGKCGVTLVQNIENLVADACNDLRCLDDGKGNFAWALVPSAVNTSCVSDDCTIRTCDPVRGCVPKDNCVSKSNGCFSYECVRDGDSVICQETDLQPTFIDLPCMKEVCINLEKVTTYPPCVAPDNCTISKCVEGYCHETPKTPDENDICMQYTCDPETGNFTATPHCDDGLYCTVDECWNYGSFYECHHETIDCAEKLNMEGYDCFNPFCREDIENYRCTRRLLPNAYVDICGYCIKEDEDSSSSSSGGEFLSCTNTPPEPLTYETLAAASIAMIILAAIIAGGAITTSGVIGTRTLIKRARDARNLAAQCNPLFEGVETEMANPAFAGNM